MDHWLSWIELIVIDLIIKPATRDPVSCLALPWIQNDYKNNKIKTLGCFTPQCSVVKFKIIIHKTDGPVVTKMMKKLGCFDLSSVFKSGISGKIHKTTGTVVQNLNWTREFVTSQNSKWEEHYNNNNTKHLQGAIQRTERLTLTTGGQHKKKKPKKNRPMTG